MPSPGIFFLWTTLVVFPAVYSFAAAEDTKPPGEPDLCASLLRDLPPATRRRSDPAPQPWNQSTRLTAALRPLTSLPAPAGPHDRVRWDQEARAAERAVYTELGRMMGTAEGRAELEASVRRMVSQWKHGTLNDGTEDYPPGLTPKSWREVRDAVNPEQLATFFAVVNGEGDQIGQITKNFANTAQMARFTSGYNIPGEREKYLRNFRQFAIFRVVAEAHLGLPPDELRQ